MSFRLATFNVENLMNRFDFTGYRNQLHQDRALALYEIKGEAEYRLLEQARAISQTDDTRQLTALAIAATRADILCLQEVDNIESLRAFEYGYLFKMVGAGYLQKFTTSGNDTRGIDVALMMREHTREGDKIEFVEMTSHAALTFGELGLHTPELQSLGLEAHERIFRRDCLQIDLRISGKPLSVFVVHLKSMTGGREGHTGRDGSMPLRRAEASAVRRVIESHFGRDRAADENWVICGDCNDYRERIIISGDDEAGYAFSPVREQDWALDVLVNDGFAENVVERLPEMERWTLYHTRGPQERHLCQLDYILLSPALARRNAEARPEIIRAGQPYRTVFPEGQEVPRFPRTGWDRPKASDHCPVAITLQL